jgi:hypothetical protein
LEGAELIEAWRATIVGPTKSWVLFEHGTCVILTEPEDDLELQATDLLRDFGPVHAGSSAGDFGVITLTNGLGWAVTSHHNDILTFVGPDEVEAGSPDVTIGLFGRSKRGQDAAELRVLHVEDRRGG